jgi:putative hydrolase of the HAD superfamily
VGEVLRAVLFDLDGTLMDHDAARVAGLRAHLARWLAGTAFQESEAVEEEWRRLEALHYDEYTSGACSFQEQRRRRVHGMHAALGRERSSDAAADEWFEAYLRHYRAAWRPFADAAPALAALSASRGRPALGVVTNGEGEPQRAKLAAIGLAEHFTVVVASGEAGVAKPQAAIFELACERLGVDPAQAAHVGDRLDLDASAAAQAGLQGVWLDRAGAASAPKGEIESVTRITTLRDLGVALEA